MKILIKDIVIADNNIRTIYDCVKVKFKDVNMAFIKPHMIFGLDHIIGIIKMIKENSKLKKKRAIKNPDIEFLLRICYTNQISQAFEKIEYNKMTVNNNKNNRFIYILFSECLPDIEKACVYIEQYNQEEILEKKKDINTLIGMSESKKAYILKNFFNKELRDIEGFFFIKDNIKFQKFLVERAAIALR